MAEGPEMPVLKPGEPGLAEPVPAAAGVPKMMPIPASPPLTRVGSLSPTGVRLPKCVCLVCDEEMSVDDQEKAKDDHNPGMCALEAASIYCVEPLLAHEHGRTSHNNTALIMKYSCLQILLLCCAASRKACDIFQLAES
jgi:hypothetical protein